ncbi:PAS domain S-box protein [Fulvivirgaceae bacterium LMO-SS25]
MKKDPYPYKILVVEDNLGDFILVEDYLIEEIIQPELTHAKDFKQAKACLSDTATHYDVILLDLSLPDKSGEELISETLAIANNTPILVLTGFSDLNFAIKSLSLGISDYLIKENISPTALYKSIIYNIERFKFVNAIQESEKKYSELFHLSPIPMWVYDLETLAFLDVNSAATDHYGYSFDEFMSMTIANIRPKEDLPKLQKAIEDSRASKNFKFSDHFRHIKKNGDLILVEIRSNYIDFKGAKAELILATDITERVRYIEEIEDQNKRLKEIAWVQSHVVRAPLARIMALIELLKDNDFTENEREEIHENIILSAHEMDDIIKDITLKTSSSYSSDSTSH